MKLTRGRILVIRHGETEWSLSLRHTGRTDIPLTAHGELQAAALAPRLEPWHPSLVLSSPLVRARRTAELAGLEPEIDEGLLEWDYGSYEGRTTDEIRTELGDPDWTVWSATTGLGESVDDVGRRAAAVLDRVRPLVDDGQDVALVAHAHLLRILTAVWLDLPAERGVSFVLQPAGAGVLGYERDTPALRAWNS
ncbi:MAG: histidine phosphatase family protein [Candidatus Nanopelagicales bacterium]